MRRSQRGHYGEDRSVGVSLGINHGAWRIYEHENVSTSLDPDAQRSRLAVWVVSMITASRGFVDVVLNDRGPDHSSSPSQETGEDLFDGSESPADALKTRVDDFL